MQLGVREWVVSPILDAQLPKCFAFNQRVSCLRRHLVGIDNCGRMYAAKHSPSNSIATSREPRTVPGFLVTLAARERGGLPPYEQRDPAEFIQEHVDLAVLDPDLQAAA